MVEEVRRSAADEEAAIHALFGSMQRRPHKAPLWSFQCRHLSHSLGLGLGLPYPGEQDIQVTPVGVGSPHLGDEAACPSTSQYEEKDKAFKEQLSHLATLLPTLQVHLVICSSFLSLANKAEFLDLGYVSATSSCE
ncbi:hypothetical protein CB1_000331018 [Camelus ferus]|nr:hypothetical protein CB1_000331018 [Camelus ferus]